MGVKASPEGYNQLCAARRRDGRTDEAIASSVLVSRSTVQKFLHREPISLAYFEALCRELGLDSKAIADWEENDPIDTLVQTVRAQVSSDIQRRCDKMRVLDMEQAITIDSIYTSVNILEKLSHNQRPSVDELLDGCDLENFDRLSLGRVRQERISGLEAVERHSKLFILGKPGAGKTTFLKWLALQCNTGKLHRNCVPIFVTLKEFAEADGKHTLTQFITQHWTECGIENAQTTLEQILRAGRSLILLDGLDEVQERDGKRILNVIQQASRQFDANQFVMTCRIAAKEYTFEQFTEVEVADFDKQQIADFAHKWFQHKDPTKATEFPKALESQPGLQELATNPLLLTLLCLVYGERAGFPANRSELYKEGLDVLLKKWDGKRNITRDEVYKELTLQRKEDLLSQVAFTAFERGEYFFKQKFVEAEIQDYIRNLPNSNTDPEVLRLDSEAVLKSIEAQHGLLVERARGIYSFSHLTFQEYFMARQIEKSGGDFSNLLSHLSENRWREVFLIMVGMLKNADQLLQAMKNQIDGILANDKKLQEFLSWVEQKSRSVEASYKPAAIRAHYLIRALSLDLDSDLNLNHALDRALDRDRDRTLDHTINCNSDLYFAVHFDRALDLARALDVAPEFQQELQRLKDQLPSAKNWEGYEQWWKTNGPAWIKQFRTVLIYYHNIGRDWQFTEAQENLLLQYYNTNQLLVDCLNSDCYVSREVREEIEATLLLPIASLGQEAATAQSPPKPFSSA
ncbi:NACHT domain-containing NTPase [Nostoc sp. CHAB 5715]|uniref:NACHT domain-containing protein n=1 Tax=Nostoc sp. CHAB 5715 TaxID=2780400 RepID=UPI001E3DC170|nr:NACHT domain-containing NTPase [Nostoc sp. CHAB 5715]